MNITPLEIKRVIASRGILFDQKERVLVVGKSEDHMHLPGGWCEDGELLTIACCREIEEETGIVTEHQKVIFLEETIENDEWNKPSGLLHRIDFFSIVTSQNCTIEENHVDKDAGIIKYRKFITNDEWSNGDHILVPKHLKSLTFEEIKKMTNCYGMRTGGKSGMLLD